MSFADFNLHPSILKAIQICGYQKPTPIQARSIPEILNKKDIIACAQTGTGKTASFVLPALNLLSEIKSTRKARILILTPTRELANQITTAAYKYGKFLNLNIVSLVGGTSYQQQLRNLSRRVDMIVATPGRLLDHLRNHFLDLSKIEMLVLDESDRMLDMGFIDDVNKIAAAIPSKRQTLLFSATTNAGLKQIIKKLLKDPLHVNLSPQRIAPQQIKQEIYMTNNETHKLKLLKHILKSNHIYKGIIFSATKRYAEKLSRHLLTEGLQAAALHGDLRQNVRNRTILQFRQGKIQYLIATDVAARGIDVHDVTHIINFDLPKFCEDYVHRIGRTGRAGKSGMAISFVLGSEMRNLKKIERFTNQSLTCVKIPGLEPTPFKAQEVKERKPMRRDKKFSKKPFKSKRKSRVD